MRLDDLHLCQVAKLSQVHPVVHSEQHRRVINNVGGNRSAGRRDQRNHGRQVALALAVIAAHLGQRRSQSGGVEDVDATVDFADQ